MKSPWLVPAYGAFFIFGLTLPARGDHDPAARDGSDDNTLCSYLKDVESLSDADCKRDDFNALQSADPADYSRKLDSARRRKSEVLRAYESLKARATPGMAGRPGAGSGGDPEVPGPGASAPLRLQPPINERTFPAWVGPEARDLKDVVTRWLQVQEQELQREAGSPVSPEHRRGIETALTANRAKITALSRITDPAELSCFFEEACGAKPPLSEASVDGAATGDGSWSRADYERANADAARHNPAPRIGRPPIPAPRAEDIETNRRRAMDTSTLAPFRDDLGRVVSMRELTDDYYRYAKRRFPKDSDDQILERIQLMANNERNNTDRVLLPNGKGGSTPGFDLRHRLSPYPDRPEYFVETNGLGWRDYEHYIDSTREVNGSWAPKWLKGGIHSAYGVPIYSVLKKWGWIGGSEPDDGEVQAGKAGCDWRPPK